MIIRFMIINQAKQSSLVDLNQVVDLAWIDFCNKHNFQKLVAHYGPDAHRAYAQQLNVKEIR